MYRRRTRRSVMSGLLAAFPAFHPRTTLASEDMQAAPLAKVAEVTGTWTDLGEVPVIAAGTTADARKITLLQPFRGRIYLGYGDFAATSQPGTDVVCLDGDQYVTILADVQTDALYNARVVDGQLWYCVTDPEVGTDPDFVVVDEQHRAAVISSPTVVPWHVFDVASFHGQVFAAGARRDVDPFNRCCVWRQDSREQWTAIDGTEGYTTNFRTFGLVVMGDILYALEGIGRVRKTTDGVAWTDAPALGFKDPVHKPIAVEGGCLFRRRYPFEWPNDLLRYTGRSQAEMVLEAVCDHTLGDDGLVFVLTTNDVRVASSDGTAFSTIIAEVPDGACSIAKSGDTVYVGTTESHVWRYK